MGTAIGQTPAALARLDSLTVQRRARSGEERLSGQGGRGRGEEPVVRAGFGEGTLSAQSAALKTVSTNLRRARELVPSVEELQARARAAAAAAAAKLEATSEREPAVPQTATEDVVPTLVSARPQADPRARFFAEEQPEPVVRVAAPAENESTPQAPAGAEARDGASALLDILA